MMSAGHFRESVRLIVRHHNNIRNKSSWPKVHTFPISLSLAQQNMVIFDQAYCSVCREVFIPPTPVALAWIADEFGLTVLSDGWKVRNLAHHCRVQVVW